MAKQVLYVWEHGTMLEKASPAFIRAMIALREAYEDTEEDWDEDQLIGAAGPIRDDLTFDRCSRCKEIAEITVDGMTACCGRSPIPTDQEDECC